MKNLIALSLLASALSACVVVPARPGYVVAPPVVVAPAPVVVRPYYGGHYYRGW
jgi:hypothetical protein